MDLKDRAVTVTGAVPSQCRRARHCLAELECTECLISGTQPLAISCRVTAWADSPADALSMVWSMQHHDDLTSGTLFFSILE